MKKFKVDPKIHDIQQIKFLENGNELYYITRDKKIIKKLFVRKRTSWVFQDVPLTKEDEKLLENYDVEKLWWELIRQPEISKEMELKERFDKEQDRLIAERKKRRV